MRMTRGAILMSLLATGGLIALAAQEENPRSWIEGTIVDGQTGAPLPAVRVRLTPGPMVTFTDENGRFLIEGLSAGAYHLNTERVGYLSGILPGRRLPIAGGIPMMVDPGLALQQTIQLFRAPVVSGRVIDSQGQPVRNATVAPYRRVFTDSGAIGRKYSPGTTTNDLGEFRATVDTPGRYGVEVWPPMMLGRDTHVLFHPSDDRPGNDDTPFSLEIGAAVRVPDAILREGAGGRVTLQLQGAGQREGSALLVLRRHGEPTATRLTTAISAGTCELPRLAPGAYEVELSFAMGNSRGRATFEVEDHDVVLDLPVERRTDLIGRVVVDGTPGESVRPAPGVQLRLSDPSGLRIPDVVLTSREDGSFGSAGLPIGLFPGLYIANLPNVPAGMYLAAMVAGDQNLLTEALEIRDDTVATIEVHLREPSGRIKGTVRSDTGSSAAGAVVTLIPDDVTQHHLFRAAITGSQGLFALDAAPGQYSLYAWLELDGPAYRNPQFISRYQSKGQRVMLRAAEQTQIDLEAITQ